MFVRFARCEMSRREDQENFRPAAPGVFVTGDEACIRQSRRDDIGFIPMLSNKTLGFARKIFHRPSRQYFPRHGWAPPWRRPPPVLAGRAVNAFTFEMFTTS